MTNRRSALLATSAPSGRNSRSAVHFSGAFPAVCRDTIRSLNTTGNLLTLTPFVNEASARNQLFQAAIEKPVEETGSVPPHLQETYLSFADGSRHLRYGFWPLDWSLNNKAPYKDVQIYSHIKCRPGGPPVALYFENPEVDARFSPFDPAVYAILGDRNSVDIMGAELVNQCKAILATNTDPISSNFTLSPQNALAYYRDGSFSVHQSGYDNNRSLIHSSNPDQWNDFSGEISLLLDQDNVFGHCVHQTLLTTLPLGLFTPLGPASAGSSHSASPMIAFLVMVFASLFLLRH